MFADTWVLILGIPIIIALLVQTARRSAQIRDRIAQVREEQARNPLPPFAQLAELIDNQNARERNDGKRTH
jgi:hypothetical protein